MPGRGGPPADSMGETSRTTRTGSRLAALLLACQGSTMAKIVPPTLHS